MGEEQQNLDNSSGPLSREGGVKWMPAVKIMSDVSTWIIVPIVVALVAGKALDKHFGTKPILFFCLIGFAFLITCFGMYRTVKDYMSRLSEGSGSRPESVGKK